MMKPNLNEPLPERVGPVNLPGPAELVIPSTAPMSGATRGGRGQQRWSVVSVGPTALSMAGEPDKGGSVPWLLKNPQAVFPLKNGCSTVGNCRGRSKAGLCGRGLAIWRRTLALHDAEGVGGGGCQKGKAKG